MDEGEDDWKGECDVVGLRLLFGAVVVMGILVVDCGRDDDDNEDEEDEPLSLKSNSGWLYILSLFKGLPVSLPNPSL